MQASNYNFLNLQNFLIEIHKILEKIANQEDESKAVIEDSIVQKNIKNKLLDILLLKLQPTGFQTKFKSLSSKSKREKLLILLKEQLENQIKKNDTKYIQDKIRKTESGLFMNNLGNGDIYPSDHGFKMLYVIPSQNFEKLLGTDSALYHFYNNIVKEIRNDLCRIEKIKDDSVVHVLMAALCARLKQAGKIQWYQKMSPGQQRRDFLSLLETELDEKCHQIVIHNLIKRGEKTLKIVKCLLNYETNPNPSEVWNKIIVKIPNNEHMSSLTKMYPNRIIKIFLDLLAKTKEQIIIQKHKYFVNRITLWKKDTLNLVEIIRDENFKKLFLSILLTNYSNQLKIHYHIAEQEYFRQAEIEKEMKEIVAEINNIRKRTCIMVIKFEEEIKDRKKRISDLDATIQNMKRILNQQNYNGVTMTEDGSWICL